MENFNEDKKVSLGSFGHNGQVDIYNPADRAYSTKLSTVPESDDQNQEKLWHVLAHLSALAGYLLIIPFSGILGPLLVYFFKGGFSDSIKHHALESVNFQITVSILSLLCMAVAFISFNSVFTNAVSLLNIVCICWASVSAHQGKHFKYPLSMKLIR